MKSRFKSTLLGALALIALAAPARADVIVLTPSKADLWDLDHYDSYRWNINRPDLIGKTITGVSLFFDNIRNWRVEPNVLYIQLMNKWTSVLGGISKFTDNQASGNYFGSTGTTVHTYTNLPATAQDLTYNFSASEINTLTNYLADGKFSLGFDPDCHFFNDGIKLTITTATPPPPPPPAVPEPGTLALFGLGLLGAGILVRRRKKLEA